MPFSDFYKNDKRSLIQEGVLVHIFMIIEQSDVCNFADDNTLYSCGKSLTDIKENLVSDTKSILNWFRLNSLKANPGKFQFMIFRDKSHNFSQ